MHFHGYSVRIVGMGKITSEHMPPSEVRERDQDGEFPRLETNYAPMKDTFCVSFQSYVILQFVADNPGWWFVHCHLDFHSLVSIKLSNIPKRFLIVRYNMIIFFSFLCNHIDYLYRGLTIIRVYDVCKIHG